VHTCGCGAIGDAPSAATVSPATGKAWIARPRWNLYFVIARVGTPESDGAVIIEVISVGHRTVLAVEGEIDMLTAPAMTAAVDTALETSPQQLWLDFTATDFMDSTGIHALLDIQNRLVDRRCHLAVICDGSVRRLLEVTGVDGALRVYSDRDAAHRDA
jgi:anti-sigma B factor antagonist